MIRAGLLRALVLSLFVGTACAEPVAVQYDIPAGDASQTLKQFLATSQIEMLYKVEEVRGRQTNAISGNFTPPQALERMLAGTDLQFTFTDDYTFASVKRRQELRQDAGEPPAASSVSTSSSDSRMRILFGDDRSNLEEVLVTGTFIRGVVDIMSPLEFVTKRQARTAPYATIQDALRSVTGIGGATQSESAGGIGNFARGAAASLRGLGAGATLVLVDGHRQAPAGTQGDFVDLQNIPWSAVERIEVLPDGASALYGSDAIAGVVNIIMRTDFSGAETLLRQGFARGGADERLAAQLFGTSWDTGHAMLAWQYLGRTALPASARDYAANADKRPFGGSDFRSPQSSPGNILDPWTFQPAFGIPADGSGAPVTAGDLEAGHINLENPWANAELLPKRTMQSVFASVTQRLTDRIELFTDARFAKRDITQRTLPAPGLLLVPRSNPFFISPYVGVPFLIVSYSFAQDFGPVVATAQTLAYAANAGVRFKFADSWELTATGSWGQERMRYVGHNLPIMPALNAALADPDPSTAFNPFGPNARSTLDAIRGAQSEAAMSTIFTSRITADGTLLTLPSGPMRLALGGEFRREELDHGYFGWREFGRAVNSAFTELAVPLVGSAEDPRAAPRLELSLAGRVETSSDFGTTTNPKIGLRWIPIYSLKLRASWGTSFKAPRLVDAYDGSQNASLLISMPDPQLDGRPAWVLAKQGNNPAIRPETAQTWSAGIDLAPRFMPGFAASLGYFSIDYRDRVVVPGPASAYDVLLHEEEWKPIISRDPAPEQVRTLCESEFFRGSLQQCLNAPIAAIVDFSVRNLASTRVRGVDVTLDQSTRSKYGTFNLQLKGTRLLEFEQSMSADSPALELVNTVGNPLELRVHGSAEWCQRNCDAPGFRANVAFDYSGPYEDRQGSLVRDVASFATLDAVLAYRTAAVGYLGDLEISAGVANLFDQSPPFVNRESGYDPWNAEPYGRVVSISVQKGW